MKTQMEKFKRLNGIIALSIERYNGMTTNIKVSSSSQQTKSFLVNHVAVYSSKNSIILVKCYASNYCICIIFNRVKQTLVLQEKILFNMLKY